MRLYYRNLYRISMGSSSSSSSSSPFLSAMSNRCVSLAILLLCFMLAANAERDFNVNDSQVPVIEPRDAPAYQQDPYVTELMHCQHAQSEIVLSLLLRKHDWSDVSVAKRMHVQAKLAKFFAIPKEFITLDSVGKRELYSMHKLAMRKGGKGQKHTETINRRLGRASFMIGCGAKYFSMGEPIAKQIAHQIKDGTIGALTEENFGLWFIWRKELKSRSQRKRRDAEGSGAGEEDYDYGDDEEEPQPEQVTEVPTTHAHRHHHGVSDQSVIVAATSSPALRFEESVSALESVISKTIENTKNIKELPVLSVEDADAEDAVELQQQLDKTRLLGVDESVVGVPAAPVIVEESDGDEIELGNELELRQPEHNPNLQQELQMMTTTTTTTVAAPGSSHISLATVNVEDAAGNNQVDDTANVVAVDAVDVAEHRAATSTSQTTTNHNHNSNNIETPATASEPVSSSSYSSPALSPYPAVTLSSETLETSTGSSSNVQLSSTSTSSSPSPSSSSAGAGTGSTTASGSSTASAIDTDLVNTLTTTTTTTSSSSATTSSSSSSSSSSSPSSSTTTTSATIPTTATTTPTTTTTTTQSQTPKPNETLNETEIAPSTWLPTDASETDVATAATHSTLAEIEVESTTASAAAASAHSTLSISSKAKDAVGEAGEPIDALEAAVNSSSSSLDSNELATPASTTLVTQSTTRQPETSSPTDASTDYAEARPENTLPIIKMRLQKHAVTSGKAFSYVVPEETFYDAEDQTNLRLELTDKDGHELKANSWLQFNADKREIYGLPLDDAVSRWQYRLSATDSGNLSVTETVEISVQQHRAVRTINHEIQIGVRLVEKFEHNIDWQLKLIKAIAKTLEDDNSGAVVVREIRQTLLEPQTATFLYFNETFTTSECPTDELKAVVSRLKVEDLSDLVNPQITITSIMGEPIGECRKSMMGNTRPPTKNSPPMPRNQVDRVNASVGTLLVYKVPDDTFYDPNGNELTLSLKTKEHKELNPRSWMQFDSKNKEFYGIPKSGDVGTEGYLLIAEDTGGLSAIDALVVVVSNTPKKEYAVVFKAYLTIRTENFNAELQRKFVERIAKLHGDENANQIYVRSITPHHDSEGTIVNFYNNSLVKANNRCPKEEMDMERRLYLNDELKPSDALKRALGPELVLSDFTVATLFACQHGGHGDISSEYIPPRSKEPTLKPAFTDEYLATFILPAIIIVVMILLASIIACCLHRRRHKSGKMELGDEEERKSFRTKGIPVIFQDEFEEKPEIGNKSPVILKDEKPPLLPPSYNTSNMNGDNDVDEYVPPPAVVLGGREVRGKSPATPSYRKPPPYVSP